MQRAFDELAVQIAFCQIGFLMRTHIRRRMKAAVDIVDRDLDPVQFDALAFTCGDVGCANGFDPTHTRSPEAEESQKVVRYADKRSEFVVAIASAAMRRRSSDVFRQQSTPS